MRPHNKLDPAQLDRIRSLLLDGHTVSQTVRASGISRPVVNQVAAAMRAEGIPVMRAAQGRRPKVPA
jgi:hypothetical protein